MEANNKWDSKSEERRKFVRAMRGLEPGDVITHLSCCLLHRNEKILVLGHDRDKGELLISEKSERPNITLSGLNPFRWDGEQERWVDRKGSVETHIGPGVKVCKGAGRRELALFRTLPDPQEAAGYLDVFDKLVDEGNDLVMDLVLPTKAILENEAYEANTVAMMAAARYTLGGNACPLSEEQLARVALVFYIAQRKAELDQRMEEIAAAARFFDSMMGAAGKIQNPGA